MSVVLPCGLKESILSEFWDWFKRARVDGALDTIYR